MKETRILLTEDTFTQVCKAGFLKYQSPIMGKTDIYFYKHDIITLSNGEVVSKEYGDEVVKFMLQDIGKELIREIIKRSPVYYELSTQM